MPADKLDVKPIVRRCFNHLHRAVRKALGNILDQRRRGRTRAANLGNNTRAPVCIGFADVGRNALSFLPQRESQCCGVDVKLFRAVVARGQRLSDCRCKSVLHPPSRAMPHTVVAAGLKAGSCDAHHPCHRHLIFCHNDIPSIVFDSQILIIRLSWI